MTICEYSGKERFGARSEASERAAHLNRRRGETRKVYSCAECGGYHVGGEARRRKGKRK